MSKQLLNSPNSCIEDFISGLVNTHRGLMQVPGHSRVVLRKDLHNIEGKVAVLSGGGSGHEPAHLGFVGRGMLTGAAAGAIFTSPSAPTVLAAIKSVSAFRPSGVLLIVTNYTGDRVNFGLAREWARKEGIKVEMVVVGEDCAVTSADRSTGRRGLAGTILVHKIGGALSELGESLQTIARVLNNVVQNMGTIGICLEPCILPGFKAPSFTVESNVIELGLGVHGEAGVTKIPLQSCSAVVKVMLDYMTNQTSASHLPLRDKDEVVVLINNMGGTSNLEAGIFTNDVVRALLDRGVVVKKVFSGTYVTAMQMAGISLTILKVNSRCFEDMSLVDLLELPADTPCPLRSMRVDSNVEEPDPEIFRDVGRLPLAKTKPQVGEEVADLFRSCVKSACEKLVAVTRTLNEYDSGAGDADCGTTHARGAEAILAELNRIDFHFPSFVFQKIGLVCSDVMGGTSGAMYSLLFAGIATKLAGSEEFTSDSFARALQEGIASMKRYGGAHEGDRTMLDVLQPLTSKLWELVNEDRRELCGSLIRVSEEAAEATIGMRAKSGRASYVSQDRLVNPDPGATAIKEIACTCARVVMDHD